MPEIKIPNSPKSPIGSPNMGVVASLEKDTIFLSFSEMADCKKTEKFLQQKENKRALGHFIYKIAKCKTLNDIKKQNGFHYEKLKGRSDYTLRVNDQYRVSFYHSDISENFIHIKSIFEHDEYKRK